jgi:hypothetical protein
MFAEGSSEQRAPNAPRRAAFSSPGSEEGEEGMPTRFDHAVMAWHQGGSTEREGAVVGAGGINPAVGAAHVLETCATKRERRERSRQTVNGFRPPCPVNVLFERNSS